MRNSRFMILSGVLLLGIIASLAVGTLAHPFVAVGYRELEVPLDEFPAEVGGWTLSREMPLTKREIEIAGLDRYVRREYDGPDGESVMLYICYYGNKQRGVDAMFHNPTVCLPAAGWQQIGSEVRTVRIPDIAKHFEVSIDRFRNQSREIVLLNFFVINGEVLEEPPRNKPFWVAYDKLKLNTDPGYFAQIVIVVGSGADDGNPGKVAVRFLEQAGAYIRRHFDF